MRVDLILWPGSPPVPWSTGDCHRLPAAPESAARCLKGLLAESSAGWMLFWDGTLGQPDLNAIRAWARSSEDAVHGGLQVGTAGQPEGLEPVMLDWSWIDPARHQQATSWRMSLRCALIRTEALRTVDAIDPAFETLEGAGLELGYRLMRRGALVLYDPKLASERGDSGKPSPVDRYVFVRRWLKPRWARYLEMRRFLGGAEEARAAAQARAACQRWPAPDPGAVVSRDLQSRERPLQASVTAIIPTLGRYPYVPGALSSLAEQTVRPEEILVVDQNPPESREPEIYEPYADQNVRVIWQDQRGQSLARNAALEQARGEYLFLFEDDAVAEPDLIEQHLRVIQGYNCHVSTGVSVPPPPTDYVLPEEFRFTRVAQTFSSGNSLLTREVLRRVGGFDRCYDHGVNADMDFGTRLYLAGGVIIHNPHARMVHYKAPMGGLRVYGHWWAHSNLGLLRAFPPPTQLYYMLRFLTPQQRRERLLRFLALAAIGWEKRQSHAQGSRLGRAARGLLSLPFMPYRLARSYREARQLLERGPQIPPYAEPEVRPVERSYAEPPVPAVAP